MSNEKPKRFRIYVECDVEVVDQEMLETNQLALVTDEDGNEGIAPIQRDALWAATKVAVAKVSSADWASHGLNLISTGAIPRPSNEDGSYPAMTIPPLPALD